MAKITFFKKVVDILNSHLHCPEKRNPKVIVYDNH